MSVHVELPANAASSRAREADAVSTPGWPERSLLVVFCVVQVLWIAAVAYGVVQAAQFVGDLR